MKIKKLVTTIVVLIASATTILIPATLLVISNKNVNNSQTPNNPPVDPSPPINPPVGPPVSPPVKPPVKPPITPDTEIPSDINTSYFKNSVNLIDSPGTYGMATPGSGKGQNSIVPSLTGPSRTVPSDGIPEDASLNKSNFFNDNDIIQSKRTVSLWFNNGVPFMGTGWILDYKLTEDGTYPLTWYFGTNAHVIQNLKVKGDVISPERYEENINGGWNTDFLTIRKIADPKKDKKYSNSIDDSSSFSSVQINPKYDENKKTTTNLKTIFIGNDYLKTSPGMFSTNSNWINSEEYIDFAVLEVTFDNENDAKIATHDYAELEHTKQFKYKQESLLKNQNAIIENGYKVIGYPNTPSPSADVMLNQSTIQMFSSIPESPSNIQKSKGTNLATSPYYNTFKNKKGVFDAALALSFFGYNYRMADQKTKFYNSWGLAYPVDYGKLGPGSSGSMLMDENGYTVGIHFAGDNRATMGLAQALYCEGFNYNGAYGSYNLEGYDLIKGGFPNQKKSYLDGLKQLYGNETNFKTNLFPNGLNGGIRSFE